MHSMSTGCSGDLTMVGSRGVFSDGEGKYRNGLDCRWKIAPSLTNTFVTVIVTRLELLDAADRLEIYDGPTTADPLLATYTGSSIPPPITSSTREMLVRLVTDAAGENG